MITVRGNFTRRRELSPSACKSYLLSYSGDVPGASDGFTYILCGASTYTYTKVTSELKVCAVEGSVSSTHGIINMIGNCGKIRRLVMNDVFKDPCEGPIVSIYREDETDLYFYSRDEVNYTAADGMFYYGGFRDTYSGDWIWETIIINKTSLSYSGGYQSQCGPY